MSPLSLFAGYYPDSTKITSITEILNVNVNLLNQAAVFSVWHFSGYILAERPRLAVVEVSSGHEPRADTWICRTSS